MRLRRRISINETNQQGEEYSSPSSITSTSTNSSTKKQSSSLLSLRRLKSGANTATSASNHVHNRRHFKKKILFMLFSCLVVFLMTTMSFLGSQKQRKKKKRKRIISIIKNVFYDPPVIDYYADPPFDPSFNDPDTQIPVNANAANLFLYGHEWREGVANWLITLSEIFIIAKAINATVILPCIQRGRLVPCLPQSQSQLLSQAMSPLSNNDADWSHRLGDVFNLDRIRMFHPYFVEQEEFQQILDQHPTYKEYKFCHLYRWRFKGDETEEKHRCTEGSYVYGHQNTTNPFLEQATRDAYAISQLELRQQQHQQQHDHAPVVMNMTKYDKWGWRHTLFNHKHIVPGGIEYTQEFKLKYFPFQERYSLFVDKLLDEAGIVNHDYVVIQWRAELHTIDYLECAKHIVTARDLLQKRNSDIDTSDSGITKNTKFILMSSLNSDESVVWNELSMGSQARDALHYLLDDHGFLKIDTLVAKHKEEAKDQIDYAILDTIMAVKAKKYVFCDLSCDDDSICAQCGHRGQFPRFALKLREAVNQTSTMCWPEPSIFDWWR